jgi:transposase
VDAEGLPIRLALTPGQASDVHGADMLYEKFGANFLAMVKLAAIRIWLRSIESTA